MEKSKFEVIKLSGIDDTFVAIILSNNASLPDTMQRGFVYVGADFIAGERVLVKHFMKHLIAGTVDKIKSIIIRCN